MIELSEYDVKLIIGYIDSCLSTKYNQEMSWNELKSYHTIKEVLIKKEEENIINE